MMLYALLAAIAPALVTVTADPSVTVRVTPRSGNTSKTVDVTVNKQDRVTQNGGQVYPKVLPPPPPPPPEMHAGIRVDPASFMAPGKGFDHATLRLTNEVSPPDTMGDFRTVCDPSHMSFDDPIVYPGQPGKAHAHVFFGNTGTNAASTAASLLATGNSTCRGGTINRSSYWVPVMTDTKTNAAIKPATLIVYYKTGGRGPVKPSTVQPFPAGLRMIAGNPAATGPGNPNDAIAHFTCNGNNPFTFEIPTCKPGESIWASVVFPQCWDGKNLDSPDHKSHMAYSIPGKGCTDPAHPVPLPEVAFNVLYTVPAGGTASWRLASDVYSETLPGGYSFHGDWFNGWRQDVLETWVKHCDQPSLNCDAHRLGDGRRMDWCPNAVDGITGCAVPPIEVTTANGWTRLVLENGFTFLDIDRMVRFGPNADGGYITQQGKAGSNYCNAQQFGWPKAAPGVVRGCEIATPNPFSP